MLLDPAQARSLYEYAARERFAILAVNADSPSAILDCLQAAQLSDAPLIIETSLWQLTGRSFGDGDPILGMTRYLTDLAVLANSPRFHPIPIIYHTDHIKGPATERILTAAIEGLPIPFPGIEATLTASSISLDSSELTPEDNVRLMCRLCEVAEATSCLATLEMEAGVDCGVTPIEETEKVFGAVEDRHPDHLALWAPGVGTQHGLADGNHVDPAAIHAHQKKASEICERPIGLALHGSSGLSNDALKEAVAAGTVKVNWSSESLLIRAQAARRFYATRGDQLEKSHPNFKKTAMDNGIQSYVSTPYIERVRERIETLNGNGKAGRFMATLEQASPKTL